MTAALLLASRLVGAGQVINTSDAMTRLQVPAFA